MQALTLPARSGWLWLSEGFAIFRRHQLRLSLAVLSYWILMALINSVPLLGQMVATLLIPVFSVSLMNACRVLEQGGPPPPQLLFTGFQQNPRQLLMLGAVYIAASVVILAIVAVVDGGVYDLTRWAGLHPGGSQRILDLCGTDATERFQVQHSRNPRSNAQLDGLRIGTLA